MRELEAGVKEEGRKEGRKEGRGVSTYQGCMWVLPETASMGMRACAQLNWAFSFPLGRDHRFHVSTQCGHSPDLPSPSLKWMHQPGKAFWKEVAHLEVVREQNSKEVHELSVIQSVLHLVLCMPAMGPRKTKPDSLWSSWFLNSDQAIQWISRCSKKQAFLMLVIHMEIERKGPRSLHMCHMKAVVGNHWAEFLHTILHSLEAGLLQIPNQNTTEIQQKAEQRVSH